MTSLDLSVQRAVIADRIIPRTLAADAVLVLGGAAFTALMAQLVVPMWPVPITGQTLAALLVGASLGWARGASAMVLFALVGVLGAPISAANAQGAHPAGIAWLTSPSFGYVVGMILAAGVVGWLAERKWDRRVLKAIVAFLAGEVVVYAVGLPWLAVSLAGLGLPHDAGAVLASGLTPFLLGDAIKALAAGALLPAAWWLVRRARRED